MNRAAFLVALAVAASAVPAYSYFKAPNYQVTTQPPLLFARFSGDEAGTVLRNIANTLENIAAVQSYYEGLKKNGLAIDPKWEMFVRAEAKALEEESAKLAAWSRKNGSAHSLEPEKLLQLRYTIFNLKAGADLLPGDAVDLKN